MSNTPQRIKLIDVFMAFLVVVGVVQFVYCVLAGNYVCLGDFSLLYFYRYSSWVGFLGVWARKIRSKFSGAWRNIGLSISFEGVILITFSFCCGFCGARVS